MCMGKKATCCLDGALSATVRVTTRITKWGARLGFIWWLQETGFPLSVRVLRLAMKYGKNSPNAFSYCDRLRFYSRPPIFLPFMPSEKWQLMFKSIERKQCITCRMQTAHFWVSAHKNAKKVEQKKNLSRFWLSKHPKEVKTTRIVVVLYEAEAPSVRHCFVSHDSHDKETDETRTGKSTSTKLHNCMEKLGCLYTE